MREMLLALFTISTSFYSNAQCFENPEEYKIYFKENQEFLDPIEGIWILNVSGTTTILDSIPITSTKLEEVRSEWAVIRIDDTKFKVCNIGKNESGHQTSFEAEFEKTAVAELYTYRCQFIEPSWIGKSMVKMTKGVLLEYEYFASDVYLDSIYGTGAGKTHTLKWNFAWVKRYPFLSPKPNYHRS
jgi:hypothetical protein